MQRIACVASVLILLITGCTTPNKSARAAPAPLLATKANRPVYRPQPLPPRPLPLPPRPVEPAPRPIVRAPEPVRPAASGLPAQLMPSAGLQRGKWQVIVVHHSDSTRDNVTTMNRYHKVEKGWQNGLGYHFVIGNGVTTGDGEIYKGPRWDRQQTGAHCKAGAGRFFGVYRPNNFFNAHGVGICLVGDFENGRPSSAQMASLERLTTALCVELNISPQLVYGHGQVTGSTACPGRGLKSQLAALRSAVSRGVAHGPVPLADVAQAGQLLPGARVAVDVGLLVSDLFDALAWDVLASDACAG